LGGDDACSQGHRVARDDGVLRLVTPDFARQLEGFLPALQDYRTRIGRRILDAGAYPLLPYGPAARGNREWAQRQYDLGVVIRLLAGGGPRRVLDVGAYNGWLSHQLARRGHRVTGVDPFTDPHDGLGARRFYAIAWEAVQIDPRDLTVLNTCYDLVVLNRCLAFFPDPLEGLRQAQARVAAGGRLVALGLQFFGDPRAKARQVAEREAAFQQQYGLPAALWPTRGYLDNDDAAALRGAGLRLHRQPQLWLADLRARLRPTLPRHAYGVWEPDGA
jgi:SAM-dependent methyltransferase